MTAFTLFGVIGLALGSFGNVLVLRFYSGEGIGGRSHCPKCRRVLRVHDLIPLFSYLWLRGHCRTCKERISIQYPLVEAGSMLLFLLALFLSPHDPLLAFLTGSVLYFVFLSCVFDFHHEELPDAFTIVIAILGLIIVLLSGNILSSLLGACVPLVWLGGQWAITRGQAVGSGDIFLATAIGFWLGVKGSIVMMFGSYMVGAIIVLFLLVTGKLSHTKKRIAFAPFIGISTLLALLGVGDLYLKIL